MSRVPIVAVVGRSGAGKTTLLCGLIKHLSARGYRIGALKHAPHGFQIDYPGKDSARLKGAGAEAVLVASPTELAFIRSLDAEPGLEELQRYFDAEEFDLILAEGFHAAPVPKIGVSRQATAAELEWLIKLPGLIALALGLGVGDQPGLKQESLIPSGLPLYRFDQLEGLAAFLEARFNLNLKLNRGRRPGGGA